MDHIDSNESVVISNRNMLLFVILVNKIKSVSSNKWLLKYILREWQRILIQFFKCQHRI